MPVYFIQSMGGGPVKIGFTDTIEGVSGRLQAIQIGNPFRLEVVHVEPTWDRQKEKQIHADLKPHRMSGEWFKPVSAVVKMCGCIPHGEGAIYEWFALQHERENFNRSVLAAADGKDRTLRAQRAGAIESAKAHSQALKKALETIDPSPEKSALIADIWQMYARHGKVPPRWFVEIESQGAVGMATGGVS